MNGPKLLASQKHGASQNSKEHHAEFEIRQTGGKNLIYIFDNLNEDYWQESMTSYPVTVPSNILGNNPALVGVQMTRSMNSAST